MRKLSARMIEVLQAADFGKVLFMPTNGMYDSYFYRTDTGKACTPTVEALIARRLLKMNNGLRLEITSHGVSEITSHRYRREP